MRETSLQKSSSGELHRQYADVSFRLDHHEKSPAFAQLIRKKRDASWDKLVKEQRVLLRELVRRYRGVLTQVYERYVPLELRTTTNCRVFLRWQHLAWSLTDARTVPVFLWRGVVAAVPKADPTLKAPFLLRQFVDDMRDEPARRLLQTSYGETDQLSEPPTEEQLESALRALWSSMAAVGPDLPFRSDKLFDAASSPAVNQVKDWLFPK